MAGVVLTAAHYAWTAAFVGFDVPAPDAAPDGEAPGGEAPGGEAPGGEAPGGAVTDGDLHDFARWPARAHAAWQMLDIVQRVAVVKAMTSRYGRAFSDAFIGFTKSGARSDQQHYGPGFPEHTEKWFEDRGYKLADRDSLNDWWVHPSGHEITADRGLPWPSSGTQPAQPAPSPKPDDPAELMKLTTESIEQYLAQDEQTQQDLADAKAALDKMDVTSDRFAHAYKEYVGALDQAQKDVQAQVDEINDNVTALKEMGADVDAVEASRGGLDEALTAIGVQRDLLDMEGRKPINADIDDSDGSDDDGAP